MSTTTTTATTTTANLTASLIRTYDKLLLANQNSQPTLEANQTILESLNLIKNYLIGASIGGPDTQPGLNFIKLQNHIELNASLVLLRWLSQTANHPSLSSSINPSQLHHVSEPQLINQLSKTFVILQGLLHLHPPSQRLFSSEFNLKILLSFLPLSLHSSKFSPIALPLLDLLLITFVDSPVNAQLFESAGGLEILVQAMKQKGLKTELRVKVLETLWAWWIDEEETTDPDTPLIPPSMTPGHPSPKFNPAFPSPDFLSHLSSASSVQQPNHQTPQKRSRPKSSHHQINHQVSETPPETRGNSRVRPISLPPPSLSEQPPDIALANLSDGRESSMAKSPHRSPIASSTDSRKPILKAKLTITQTEPTPPRSAAMMVKSSSEGAQPSDTPSRPGTSWDPASRLRMMLENTAGEFIPATPHHPRRVRPATSNDYSSSPRREPHVLHKSHPTPQNQRFVVRNDSEHQMISEQPPPRPSDDSEDSDQMNISPHRLFAVRQRRTAIKQGNNTPQRLIRHKQSASLGSIQHQFQPQQTPKARTQSHRSSGEEPQSGSGSGSEPDGPFGRARDRTVRPVSSSHPFSPRSTSGSEHERPITPNPPRRPSSTLSRSISLLDPGTPTGESSARKKIARVDAPATVRPNRIAKTITPTESNGGKPVTTIRPSSPSLRPSHREAQEKILCTPNRTSRGKSTISMPLTTPTPTTATMMTPTTTRRDPSDSHDSANQDNKNRAALHLTPNLSFVTAAHKRLIINRPLTPNKSLINQADLESIVNGTDSDVGASIALSPKKESSSSSALLQQKRKSLTSSKKLIMKSKSNNNKEEIDEDNEDELGTESPLLNNNNSEDKNIKKLKKKITIIPRSSSKDPSHQPELPLRKSSALNHKLKTGILEKYMANSDELVRSFKEIGIGFSLLNHHS